MDYLQTYRGLAARIDDLKVMGDRGRQHMRRAGLLTVRREGKYVFYRLADEAVLDFLASVRRIAERNSAEVAHVVRSYFDERDSLEPVSRRELKKRLKAELVTVLDLSLPKTKSDSIDGEVHPGRRW